MDRKHVGLPRDMLYEAVHIHLKERKTRCPPSAANLRLDKSHSRPSSRISESSSQRPDRDEDGEVARLQTRGVALPSWDIRSELDRAMSRPQGHERGS